MLPRPSQDPHSKARPAGGSLARGERAPFKAQPEDSSQAEGHHEAGGTIGTASYSRRGEDGGQDVLRISTKPFDPVVTALTGKSGDTEDASKAMRPRTATVDLLRNAESGRISVARLVCMEFLGLGGSEAGSGQAQVENNSR